MAGTRRGGAGGIGGLLELIASSGEAIDADLQHHYGLSLADVTTGRVTLRRLAGLLRGLPVDGTAMWRQSRRAKDTGAVRAVAPPDEWWTPERDLLASAIDALHVLAWQKTKDAAEGVGFPEPIPRPGVRSAPPARVPLSPDEVKARLAQMSGRPTT